MYGPLYYRDLEAVKSSALKMAKGEFDTPMSLSPLATQELQWWVSNVETAHKRLSHDKPLHQITIDASLLGWGAECNGISSGGTWTKLEATNDINYLEMLAILFGLQTFAKDKENTHIRIRCNIRTTRLQSILLKIWVQATRKNATNWLKQFGSGVLAGAYGSV